MTGKLSTGDAPSIDRLETFSYRQLFTFATPEEPYVWTIDFCTIINPLWSPAFSIRQHVHEYHRFFNLEEALNRGNQERSERLFTRRLRNLVTGDIIMACIL